MSSIFISYRRNDAGGHVGRLYDHLLQWFDSNDLFYDQSSIESGDDFPDEIEAALNSAQVILVAIGPDWLTDENRQRLCDTKDFVRREVAHALKRKRSEIDTSPLIIPVLVGGAEQPDEISLPESLQALAQIDSHEIQGDFDTCTQQIELLCELIACHSQSWIDKNSQWFKDSLADKDISLSSFHQDISVLNPEHRYIQRNAVDNALTKWWESWKEFRKPFVLLGEEGYGKSWALASWIAKLVNTPDLHIPIIYIPATIVDSADIITEMAKALGRANNKVNASAWESRLKLIMQGVKSDHPQILLIVDGLNERPSFDWRLFFDKYFTFLNSANIALIVSCRTGYWEQQFAAEYNARASIFAVPQYNDDELDVALSYHQLTRSSFSPPVLELVAKPRYFAMAVRLKDQLEETGEGVSIDRLIYEDWKDKIGRKRSPAIQISDKDFHAIIVTLVNEYGTRVSTGELAQVLAIYGDQAKIRSELISSGILKNQTGRFEIAYRPMVLGLGILLADEIERSGETGRDEIDEIIAKLLGPNPDSDRLVQVCAMALFHALLADDYPDTARLALFRAWVAGRNLDEADFERICANFPLRPRLYFRIAEELWSGQDNNREAQDHFMAAFLQQCHLERVQDEMASAFERWFGFIHPYGFKGLFERNPDQEKHDELIDAVASRLGQPVEEGSVDAVGYHFEVIPDINLLRLGQVAASVISHFNRQPFRRALTTGLVAQSIMAGSHTEFSWVLRTADVETHDALADEAQRLITQSEPATYRAAYQILSSLCTERALKLRDSIPVEYHVKHPFMEEDPCNSFWLAWNAENYCECVKQTKMASIAIATKLKYIAINPANILSIELAARLDNVLSVIDFSQVRSHLGHTREDSDIKEIEPALCAYRPDLYLTLARSLTALLSEREGQARRLVGFEVFKHLPVLETEDRAIILTSWRAALGGDDEEDNYCESILFYLVTFDASPLEQLELVLERGDKSSYFTNCSPSFRRLTSEQLPLLVQVLEKAGINEQKPPIGLLWYLSQVLTELNVGLRNMLLSWVACDDAGIRGCCLEIICNTRDEQAAKYIVDSGWRVDQLSKSEYENEFGSILLCEHGHDVPYINLASRIMPHYFGYALQTRGLNPEEADEYLQLLHTIWSRIVYPEAGVEQLLRHVAIKSHREDASRLESWSVDVDEDKSVTLVNNSWGGNVGTVDIDRIKRAFDPNVAKDANQAVHKQIIELYEAERKRGNHWVDLSFPFGNLKEVVQLENNTWRQWVEPVLSGGPVGRRHLVFCQGFYEQLCAALLDYEPETGIALYKAISESTITRIIDADTGIRSLLFHLFSAKDSQPVAVSRRKCFEECNTDNDLLEIALLAELCGQNAWLAEIISEMLDSDKDFDKARGLQLLGFSNDEDNEGRIKAWIKAHGRSWVMDVARSALQNQQRNMGAKEWLHRFSTVEDRVESWAAFRLYLQCVDRRYWIWEKNFVETYPLSDWQRDAVSGNRGSIKDAIKENEKKLNDTYIGQKVKNDQLWPWMKKYLSN